MESLFLLAFGEEEFFIAFAMACSEAFFNNLLIRTYQILVMLRPEVESMLVDDGGENDASLKAVAGAVSVRGNRVCFGLELFCGENRGQMAAVVSPLQIRRIVTALAAGRRVETH